MQTTADAILTMNLADLDSRDLLQKEWLLTNSRGGFVSGTLAGCCTRRYHGLLVGTLHPPASRILALANCLEKITLEIDQLEFSCFEFEHNMHPRGDEYLTAFTRDFGVHFEYELGVARLTKSIYLAPDADTVALVYAFSDLTRPFTFSIRPLTAMRDFHALQNASVKLTSAIDNPNTIQIQGPTATDASLYLYSPAMTFRPDPEWWYRFFYRIENQRGQDCFEDLWSPGWFSCRVENPQTVVLFASLTPKQSSAPDWPDLDTLVESLKQQQNGLSRHAYGRDPIQKALFLAAGQFVIQRTIEGRPTPTILAGYPWFLDWGRDTFIALPGLCLSTGRLDTAAGVLQTFAAAVSEGMIPNRFDDYGGPPHYNSIDASLWFIQAAFAWLRQSQNDALFETDLLPAVRAVIDAYYAGTRFGIRADSDSLITGGDQDTQLTWMDAKCGGVVFTPRQGKPVEINALWYNALCLLADYYTRHGNAEAEYFASLSEQVKKSFSALYWNEQTGCLHDCVFPDGSPDPSIRPNQVFAVSLPHSPLSKAKQKRVVQTVQQELLTPYGLRTLSPRDPKYIGKYRGDGFQRDSAYHQGTVWPWLMGAFIEAFLKVYDNSDRARQQAAAMLSPLIHHFATRGCLGSISEVFDGDPPHYAGGCPAQAWSVAEVLRAWLLLQKKDE